MKNFFILILLFISFCIKSQTFEWAKANRGNGVTGKFVTTDPTGNVYLAGIYGAICDFNPSALTYTLPFNGSTSNSSDVYLQKLDSAGNFLWTKGFGGIGQESVNGLALDNMGNAYMIGDFENTVDFSLGAGTNSITSNGSYDIYIQKIDVNGNHVWTKRIGGSASDRGQSITYDINGYIYITSIFSGTVDVDPSVSVLNFNSNNGSADILIEKLDLNGNLIWAKQIGGNNSEISKSIAIDYFGDITITGGFSDVVDFDPNLGIQNLTSLGGLDIFMLKLDNAGNYIWAKAIGGSNNQYGNCVAVDQAANIFLAGSFEGNVDFDPNAGVSYQNSTGGNDSYLCKYTANGNLVWAKQFGNFTDNESTNSIFVDQLGFAYLTGTFQNTVDFDPGVGINQLSSSGYSDVYISKFDNNGDLVWVRSLQGSGDDEGNCVYVDSIGKIYATGYFLGNTDFDPSPSSYTYSPSGCCNESFVLKWGQNICSYFTMSIDTLSDLNCTNLMGFAACHASNGTAPYNYNWQTVPSVNTNTVNFTSGGLLQLSVSDAGGCVQTRTLITTNIAHPGNIDLRVNAIINSFRVGFLSYIFLDAFNDGCVPANGSLKYVIDNKLTYNYASPPPTSINADTLIWSFSNIKFDSLRIMPTICVTTKTTTVIGDSIKVNTIIGPLTNDVDVTNNSRTYKVPVINGFDPNDIKVYPTGNCTPGYILNNQILTYTIRFQNTGNASAINISVLDSIDLDLNINTLRIIGKSHEAYAEVVSGHAVKFHFNNINLPDSGASEILSHGYIIFEIMPNALLAAGTTIENKANIYFDFNEAILTNKVKNTIVTTIPANCNIVTSVEENILSNIIVFPNPTNGNITIHLNKLEENTDIEIINLLGEIVYKNTFKTTEYINFNFEAEPGIYFAKIFNKNKKETVVKIMKE